MADESKTLNLTKGEGGYVVNNPNIGPIVSFHGQRVDLTCVSASKAKQMADDKQFRLVSRKGDTDAAARSQEKPNSTPSAEMQANARFAQASVDAVKASATVKGT